MGFLNKFTNNDKEDISNDKEEQLPFDIEFNQISEENLQVEFYNKNANFKQFYDTTRLIVNEKPLDIKGHQVYDCSVSWYGHDDCQMLDEETGKYDSLRALDYKEVLAEIDLNLLQENQDYSYMVMNSLLDKQRVEKYIGRGLQENPGLPCGNYIGGIMQTENGYTKFFSKLVGKTTHNSEIMVNKRQEYRKEIESKKQRDIENKKAQIEQLQNEIDSIEK